MRMKTMKIYSFVLFGKYTHTLATSNVSFSFTIHQFLGGNIKYQTLLFRAVFQFIKIE